MRILKISSFKVGIPTGKERHKFVKIARILLRAHLARARQDPIHLARESIDFNPLVLCFEL